MVGKFNQFVSVALISLMALQCTSQEPSGSAEDLINRQPAVAGQFYPADRAELKHTLAGLFENAEPSNVENVVAIISPHAGYVFSGQIAASGFNQINTEKEYDHIFLIASSHTTYFNGASIYVAGNYITPLGEVKVDFDLAKKLINDHPVFTYAPKAHLSEHSLEVQLPFLQYLLGSEIKIVPVVIGSQSKEDCREIADALKPFLNENNLFVISSDFSHYPEYDDAQKLDDLTAKAILANSSEEFLDQVFDKKNKATTNLSTRVCGWTSILSLLYMTEQNKKIEYVHIRYNNSGDTRYGDKEKVVGYHSIALVEKNEKPDGNNLNLNSKDKSVLLDLARNTIVGYVKNGEVKDFAHEQFPENTHTKCGAFVTLHMHGKLRGCIGRFFFR